MRQLTRVTMSMRELDRLKCLQAVVDGELRPMLAAERLGMSTRQIRRLAKRYRIEGPVGLISRRRNRPSNRRLKEDLENQVVKILSDSYVDFGPTAYRALRTDEDLDLIFAWRELRKVLVRGSGAGVYCVGLCR